MSAFSLSVRSYLRVRRMPSRIPLVLAVGLLAGLAAGVFTASAATALTLEKTERRVTTDPSDQWDPAINGDIIVYSDYRSSDVDVWYYNLATERESAVTTAEGNQELTDVWGDNIVYTDYRTLDVMLYSISLGVTRDLTEHSNSMSVNPAVTDQLVAWEDKRDGNWEIYAQKLSTDEVRRLSFSDVMDSRPAGHGDTIVWQHGAANIMDIWAYDWSQDATMQVTYTPGFDERNPDVWGSRIVYESGASPEKDIRCYDLTSGTVRTLSLPGNQVNPNISRDFVAFEDVQSGTYRVKLWHLPSDRVFDLTAGPVGQYLNDIDTSDATHGRVVYTDDRTGYLDIYLTEFELVAAATGPGASVVVDPRISLDFDNLIDPGTITATISSGRDPAAGFRFLRDCYFDIDSTAQFSGEVTITVSYDPNNLDGVAEHSLKLFHWKDGVGWEDITSYVDTENNKIVGRTSSFSDFAVMAPVPVTTPASSPWSLLLAGLLGLALLGAKRHRAYA